MLNINHLQIAEQHQQELRDQAEKWRMTRRDDTYQPNKAIRRFKRKLQR